jgi:hypothetical protein
LKVLTPVTKLIKDKILRRLDIVINRKKYNEWEKNFQAFKSKRNQERMKHLYGWYTPDEVVYYWKCIGKRDFEGLKKLHKKHIKGIQCPACRMIALKKKYGSKI